MTARPQSKLLGVARAFTCGQLAVAHCCSSGGREGRPIRAVAVRDSKLPIG
jgi:hypothetical protein